MAVTLTILMLSLLLGQAFLVLGLTRRLRQPLPPPLPDIDCPPAAIVLCLRGADPFLPKCLEHLLAQDYPDFLVRIMLDHADDPAAPMTRDFLAKCERLANLDPARVQVSVLQGTWDDCSRKCAALVQAIESLSERVEVVALLDADVVPHRTWLRELCGALRPADVGAATGNRWYQPLRPNLAALVRYQWNAAAIVQMYWYHIAWGGTLAFKRSAIRAAGLLDKWRHAFCEDTMTHGALGAAGLRVAFVPSLMMVNRESCDLSGCVSWVRRQLFVARLYHSAWWLVVAHGLGTGLAIVATGTAFLASLFTIAASRADAAISADAASSAALAPQVSAALLGGTLIAYFAGLLLLLVALESSVRKIMTARGETSKWLSFGGVFTLLLATGVTQAIYPFVLASAMTLRRVSWRGLDYEVDGPWRIRLNRYVPYGTDGDSAGDQHSL